MQVVSIIIAILFFLFGILNLYHGYKSILIFGNVMLATVSRLNFLPLIVGLGLLESGNLWFLVAIPIVWILAGLPFPPALCFYFFPLISGWIIGSSFFTGIFPNSRWWYYGGGFIGTVTIFIMCTVVVGIITGGRRASVSPFTLALDSRQSDPDED
jgi:hypothetical protein